MKIIYIAVIILISILTTANAVVVGYFSGLPELIETADAIVILRIDRHSSPYSSPTLYSIYDCNIYQTLKGDIQPNSNQKLMLYSLKSITSPYPKGSTHLIFLGKEENEESPTEYRMITIEGAQILLSPFGHEKAPEGKTIEEQVINLIKDAIDYQAEEHDKRVEFLKSILHYTENTLQSANYKSDFIRLSGPVVPLPHSRVSVMFEAIRTEDDISLNFVYQALVGPQTALRANAARYLGLYGDETSIPHLIDALSDQTMHVGASYPDAGMASTRYWANDSLKKLTGLDFGFVWDDPIDKRNIAIRKWREWYLNQ